MDLTTIVFFGVGVLAIVLPPVISNNRTAKILLRERIEDLDGRRQIAKDLRISNDKLSGKLEQIHVLVNSNLTAAIQGELDQTKRSLILLKRLTPSEATSEDLEVIEETEKKIKELEVNLSDREVQTKIAKAELNS